MVIFCHKLLTQYDSNSSLWYRNVCYIIEHLTLKSFSPNNFCSFLSGVAKSNAQKQREYRERKKSNDDKFLEKERRRQKKYYTPVDKLSKTEHKKRKEAVRARVKKSREEERKLLKRVQELLQPSPSSSIDSSICTDNSGFVVKISFPSKGNLSKKED